MAPEGSPSSLQAIRYTRGSLQLLDQRLLPFQTAYLDVPDVKAAWTQIRDMVVRGAPAIGCTGALAMAVELQTHKGAGTEFSSVKEATDYINSTLDYLVTSRPTAVNLADAANKLKAAAALAAAADAATPSSVCSAVMDAAEAYFVEDIASNKAMGATGAAALLAAAHARGRGVGGKLRVLTHCNTGSLATAGYGTALGVIRALHEQGTLEHAFCTETRPYNQGARLTAFELAHDQLPATLICDSAAAALMASGQVDAVVVGADRVVANGDTANKIGTKSLSISAAHFNIPFFIAAPTTTLDPHLPSGDHIVIEQRTHEEVTHFRGIRVAAEGVNVWNPSFDVAPCGLIEGIITERGMIPKTKDGVFQVSSRERGKGGGREDGLLNSLWDENTEREYGTRVG
ncbi:eukaryotic translation initiation factor 2B alpha [Volvox carteri f. nagariensis]|uniref:Methylthioribose-1-phosphate isomerase n=1 Tax=Volvox carteri f. nagariensis TaxID=3068 RepID=D8TSQ7_VOLCA|nr:eukaryotic translation initiation factor 2B alpha [Volvox carteri f. nagariensis]EFJ49530.1 eukaryotic translation initiation factor 2B alpha [Volvox carteri f. nagariensis]|eukprot:XP_002949511.1 eukaryotic translation initiation factor 2B alpha [Volvox carteri f. nagariensis]